MDLGGIYLIVGLGWVGRTWVKLIYLFKVFLVVSDEID